MKRQIMVTVDRYFEEVCANARSTPEHVLSCFMEDVTLRTASTRQDERCREYAWGYFMRLTFPDQFEQDRAQ